MKHYIIGWRHPAPLYHFADLFASLPASSPFRKIKPPAALIDIVLDEPRKWRNVTVPRPGGFIAMAIETGALCNCAYLGRAPLGFLNDCRIGMLPPVRNQLNDPEKCQRSQKKPTYQLFHITSDRSIQKVSLCAKIVESEMKNPGRVYSSWRLAARASQVKYKLANRSNKG
jgi:hypothetical protein